MPTTLRRVSHRSGKALLPVLLGCGLAALALGLGAGVLMSRRAQAGEAHGRHSHSKKGTNKEAKVPVGTVYSLGEQVVNLADTANLRYAKFTIALGFRE